MKLVVSAIVIFLSVATVIAQPRDVDSLEHALENTQESNLQADILHQMASSSWDFDFEKGFDFASRSYAIAENAHYNKGMAVAASDIALYYYFVGDHRKSFDFYNRARTLSEKDPGVYQATIFTRFGTHFRESGRFDSALFYYDKSASLLVQSKNSRPLGLLYFGYGWLYYYRGDFITSR